VSPKPLPASRRGPVRATLSHHRPAAARESFFAAHTRLRKCTLEARGTPRCYDVLRLVSNVLI
jgi:hypothetical protein